MNIKITHSWLLEYLETEATPYEIQKYLSLSGPSVERVEKLSTGDYSYDIEITSNRVDTASVIGIAREAATILTRSGIPSKFKPPVLTVPESVKSPLPLTIEDPQSSCRRILAVIMDNVSIAPSDTRTKERLENSGIRSLNNLVDITNYVMTEMGHPTHVFDYDRIKTNKFIIRKAKKGEEIVTLDEKKYQLDERDIIIDDGTGRVIDLPGIMGTANSVVTKDTKRIIFFIESNDPVAIRSSSMRYGIRTLAATINEKSPDFHLAKLALLRGIELFKKHAGARVAGNIVDIHKEVPSTVTINTTFSFLNRKIGIVIPTEQIVNILEQLEFKVSVKGDNLSIEVPSFRSADVGIPEDIVEEVARIWGYHNLPNALAPARFIKQPKEFELLFVYQNKIKSFLKHIGLNEVLNYSMISREMIENLDLSVDSFLSLANVMSEEIRYLRKSLLASLIKNIKTNEGKRSQLRFFELAKVYLPQDNNLPKEEYRLSLATNTDFYDLKGIIEALFRELHIEIAVFKRGKNVLYSPDLSLDIYLNDSLIGTLGKLKMNYQNNFALQSSAYLAELDFAALLKHAKTIASYKPPHPYAVIKLDKTILLTPEFSWENYKKEAYSKSNLLQNIRVVDMFKDKVTVRFYFSSPNRNITEKEAMEDFKKMS